MFLVEHNIILAYHIKEIK